MTLTERQWHQIRAALIFWRATMKSSRIHPMEHRMVRHLFGGENPTPLTDQELADLTDLELVIPTCTIEQAIWGMNIEARAMQRWLRRHKIKRVGKVGVRCLYRVSDLREAVTELQQYKKKMLGVTQ